MLSLCRLCASCVTGVEISTEISELEPKLRLCCDWKSSENEERLPQKACKLCVDELQRSWSFAEKVSAAQQQFHKFTREMVSNEPEPEPDPMSHVEEISSAMVKVETYTEYIGLEQFEYDFDSGTFDNPISGSDTESLHSNKSKKDKHQKPTKKSKKATKKSKLPSNSKKTEQKPLDWNNIDVNCINERTKRQNKSTKKAAVNKIPDFDPFVAALPDEDRCSDGTISANGVAKLKELFPNMSTMTWNDCQYKCTKCARIFNGPQKLWTHVRSMHWEETHSMDFFCVYCDSKYKREFNLHRHIAEEHFPHLKFSCFYCTDYFWDEAELIKHRNLHKDIEYKCEQCGKSTWTRDSLYIHVAQRHFDRKYVDVDATYTCDLCHKVCATKTSIKTHLLQHTQQFDYVCDQCGWKFRTKGNLSNHLVTTHGNIRPFSCKQCDKRFKTKAQMEKHFKRHDDSKPVECNICKKRFRNTSNLNVHMRSHNDIFPYACKYCEKKFRYTGSLKTHERTHTSEKPYVCNHCDYKSTNWPNLNKHSLQVHSIDLRKRKDSKT
ncbi:zinc finger protein 25-like [Sitodiplosis mosellana]|uniref:zinc finger protein 25-like n=1 Tax=Sitodiplosis mosellana TaxID=263140 RepID=UPI00244406C1|nr:zinc finger protein 25-like [Sitodiplosis mosellana]